MTAVTAPRRRRATRPDYLRDQARRLAADLEAEAARWQALADEHQARADVDGLAASPTADRATGRAAAFTSAAARLRALVDDE